jgi:alginate O-acetyltransferase complex protein AlgJ
MPPETTSRSRCFETATIVLFAAALCAPLAAAGFSWDPPRTVGERRGRPPFPRVEWSRSALRAFAGGFDAWHHARFGFRNRLVRWHRALYVMKLGLSTSPKVILGRDGWLYYDSVEPQPSAPARDFRGTHPLSPARLERWRWMFADQRDWLAERDIRYLVVFPPSKETVYPEFMPTRFNRIQPRTPLQQLVDHLRQHAPDLPIVDLTGPLEEAKAREPVFWKTDTHWNDFGCYRAYVEIAERLSAWFPAVRPVPESAFERVESTLTGDLVRMLGVDPSWVERYPAMRRREPLPVRFTPSRYQVRPRVVSRQDRDDLPRALVFRDSYFEGLIELVSAHFSEAMYIWHELGLDAQRVERFKPDVVIQEIGERALRGPQRMTPRVQREMTARRFEQAGRTLWKADAAELDALAAGAAAFTLPPAIEGAAWLPIARIEVESPGASELQLAWSPPAPERHREAHRPSVVQKMDRGLDVAYLAILDPDAEGPLRLSVACPDGLPRVRSIEIRGVPRGR